MEQQIIAAMIPLAGEQYALEIQIMMRPGGNAELVELGQTNFGFLAVRVAKTLSVHFGGGKLASSEGREGEADIFGSRARWMDYSGPVIVGTGRHRQAVVEGITFFDHPDNPRYPSYWHVREDGWMGASLCMHEGLTITADSQLMLRYLLHAHTGSYDPVKASEVHKSFAKRPRFGVTKSSVRHQQFEVQRAKPIGSVPEF